MRGAEWTWRRGRSALRLAAACVGLLGLAGQAQALRILPLGDSITWGWNSESTYGYRQPLGNLLDTNGIDYSYVGTLADNLSFTPTTFLDPALRQLSGSPLHYGIPGAQADTINLGNGQSVTGKGSLLWSIRNDQDGDGVADGSFASAGGLIPTLVAQGNAPDAILLHIGSNSIGSSGLAVTPNPGLYNDNAADSQTFRLLMGLEQDLTASGLLTGSAFDTRVLLARIIPRAVNSRTTARGGLGTHSVDDAVVQNSIDYNAALDAVVASLSPLMQQAITFVDMWDTDLTDPALNLTAFRNDAVHDQPFDTLVGGNAVFNEQGNTVNSVPVDEANANGPDYADWLSRYAEEEHAFYDAALAANDLRWNQGLYGLEFNGDFYDAIHPNANGYDLMAHLWYQGLFSSGAVTVIPEPAAGAVAVVVWGIVAGLAGRRRCGFAVT